MSLAGLNFAATITSTPVAINGELYFSAEDGVHGSELWESNGTAGDTTMLTDINASNGGLNPQNLTAVGNTLYFTASDGTDGLQLWSSNGTSTFMVTDANPGLGLFAQDLTNVNGTLYFVGYNMSAGYQVYTSNGTASGTVMVADIDGSVGAGASNLTAAGSTLYFSASDGVHGTQLWESNGTASGTTMVADINGTVGSFPTELTAVGNTLYFDAFDNTHGIELWTSNGASSGTYLVADIDPGTASSLPSNLTNVNGTLFFTANDGVHGIQLWESNGTASGTTMVADINGTAGSNPTNLTVVGNTLFFNATETGYGSQLWESDGKSSGTTMVADISGTVSSNPSNLMNVNGALYFSAYTSAYGTQLWTSNGTSSATTMVADINGTAGGNLADFVVVDTTLYFTGPGATLWVVTQTTDTPPVVAGTTPAGGAAGGALGSTVTATFNEAVQSGTISFVLEDSNGNPVAAAVTYYSSTNTAVLTPSAALAPSTTYTATVSGAQDLAGTVMTSPDSWSFTTDTPPTIIWPNPANIVYGTALGSTQLDATASVAGTFAYAPASGTVLNAGNDQTLSVTFTPTDSTDYTTTTATVTIDVAQATPTITWLNPANIVYGTALGSTQLDATASVAGTFAYAPASGTVLKAGNGQTLSMTFTPTDSTDYTAAIATATINVAQAMPTISWPNPANIVYGTALGSTQLGATASVAGTFAYAPASGTVLKAGNGQTLSVTFTPTDSTDYTAAIATATTNVAQAMPAISWPNPANIVYGTALGSTQLDATASVAGTFAYAPASGTVLKAGNGQTLSVTFTPTDSTDYTAAIATATINVAQAMPTISWPNPANIVYGTALGSTQLDATASVAGTFAYAPASGAVLKAGNGQTLSVTFTPTDSTDYTAAIATATINVAQAMPTISWPNPANIVYGTALGSTQLDATASVAGTFAYAPASGTVLKAGNGQTLSMTFTPTDSTDYTAAIATATINVAQAPVTLIVSAPGAVYDGTPFPATVVIVSGTPGGNNTRTASLENTTPILTYYDGAGTLGASLGSTPPTTAGTYTVVARFPGSTDYVAVDSAPVTFTINRAAARIALTTSTGSAVYQQPITIVATVTATGTPSGTVTFSDGATPLATVPVDSSGKATLTTTGLAIGFHSITASYSGSSDLQGVTSGSSSESIARAATQVVLVPQPVFKKKKVVSIGLTAEIKPVAPGGGVPTGVVTFELLVTHQKKIKANLLGTSVLNRGEATLTVKPKHVLNETITIIYTGDPNYRASTLTTPKLT